MKTDNKELFENMPVRKAIVSLVLPTIISQMITVVYNMADTFFIGQVGDHNQVAAASLCLPIFVSLTGMANLLGIGGASLISRSLGAGNKAKAKNTSAFCVWTAVGVSLLYSVLLTSLRSIILPAVGANSETYEFCCNYMRWVITFGAVPTVLSAVLAHLVRSEGYSKDASIGVAMGGILNIILDPIFISVLNMEIAGAALATMLSNTAAMIYYIILIIKRRETTVISLDPGKYSLKDGIPKEVILVGLPSCLMNIMGVASNITINKLMASYCNEAVAGMGIAKKVDMMAFAIATGMSQGSLPLIGYNYSSKDYSRMKKAIKTTLIMSLAVSVAGAVFLFTCANPLVKAFINDAVTVSYGQYFQRVICITGPCIAITMIVITMFQAVGEKVRPLVLSFLRKGGIDIPVMIIMNTFLDERGLVWAFPVSDLTAMGIAVLLFIPFWRSVKAKVAASQKAADEAKTSGPEKLP